MAQSKFPVKLVGDADRVRVLALILMQNWAVEICLHEVGLLDLQHSDHELWRLESLHECLMAVKTYLSVFDSFSACQWLPMVAWKQVAHALIVLSKLSLIEAAGWDLNEVRRVLDIPDVLDNIIHKLEHKTGDETGTSFYGVCAGFSKILRRIKAVYTTQPTAAPPNPQAGLGVGPPAVDALDNTFFGPEDFTGFDVFDKGYLDITYW